MGGLSDHTLSAQPVDDGRTLTAAEQEALIHVLQRVARFWKVLFAFSVALLTACIGLAVVMTALERVGMGAQAAAVTLLLVVTSLLLGGYLAAVRRQVFASVEPQVLQAPPLTGLSGAFSVRTITGTESADEEMLIVGGVVVGRGTVGGTAIAVPEHWPPLPDRGTALVFLPLIDVEAPAWRRRHVPMVVEVVGWRSLDDDLRSGALASDGLRFRTTPHRR